MVNQHLSIPFGRIFVGTFSQHRTSKSKIRVFEDAKKRTRTRKRTAILYIEPDIQNMSDFTQVEQK